MVFSRSLVCSLLLKLSLFLLIPVSVFGQLSENFESGKIERWTESIEGHWELSNINPLGGNLSLHHAFDNSTSGRDQISIPLLGLRPEEGETIWRFKIRHTYKPSAFNNWAVFLMSDSDSRDMYPQALSESVVLGVNFTGSDDNIKVWSCRNGDNDIILDTEFDWEENLLTDSVVCFEVNRTSSGEWYIYYSMGNGPSSPQLLGSFNNADIYAQSFFGLYYEYSSANDRKLWFDDLSIEGVFIPDTIPPLLTDIKPEFNNRLVLTFSEAIMTPSAGDELNFYIDNDLGNPAQLVKISASQLRLEFDNEFLNERLYKLSVSSVKDITGNEMLPLTTSFFYYRAKPYDLVINEIMADPLPAVGLPEIEFVELLNRTEYDLSISGWLFGAGSRELDIPDIMIAAGEYVILCDEDNVKELDNYGRTVAIASFPAINNSGQSLYLRDSAANIISHVDYDISWYGDNYKSEGGWSLEQIDPDNKCSGRNNWEASRSSTGGSPGSENSVFRINPDLVSPYIRGAVIVADTVLRLSFSESYDRLTAGDPFSYYVDNNMANPYRIEFSEPCFNELFLYFSKHFEKNKQYYLRLDGDISDCAGNLLDNTYPVVFGIPADPDSLSLVINEILFNPLPGGVDFIELYNRSSQLINLADLRIANRDETSLELKSISPLCNDAQLILPGGYRAFCTNPGILLEQYPQAMERRIVEVEAFPSFPDKNGRPVLLDKSLNIIDEISYSDKMHFPLLVTSEGVSLERINPNQAGMDKSNWHSASEACNFATPGEKNSQYREDVAEVDPVKVEPEVFSPDNDGYNDVCSFNYSFNKAGNVASLIIFDASGRRIKILAENELLGSTGSFIWDGRNTAGERAGRGIYVFFMKVFNLDGEVKIFKKICVLALKLH